MISFTVKSLILRLRKYASIASHPSTPSDSGMLANVSAIIGSLDIVFGEIDR